MSIVNSIVLSQIAQTDGRVWVTEQHTDQLGITYDIVYLAANPTIIAAHLATSATNVWNQLVASEIANNINMVEALGKYATPTVNYSTSAQNAATLPIIYAAATQVQAIMIGDYLNTLTALQLENAFGWTAAQVATLQANWLVPAAAAAATIRSAAGI